jgi:hypothetical protein
MTTTEEMEHFKRLWMEEHEENYRLAAALRASEEQTATAIQAMNEASAALGIGARTIDSLEANLNSAESVIREALATVDHSQNSIEYSQNKADYLSSYKPEEGKN